MKRVIAMLLVLAVALSLAACGPKEVDPATAIVGKWENAEGKTMDFSADGQGNCYLGTSGHRACTWKYNAERGCFEINYSTSIHDATVTKSETGSLILTFQGVEYKKIG